MGFRDDGDFHEGAIKAALRALLAQNAARLGLTPRAIDLLVEHARMRRLRPGRTVFSERGGDDRIHFLISGAVRIVCPGTRSVVVRIVRPGQLFGLTSLFDQMQPRCFTAIAHTPSSEATWDNAVMEEALRRLPPDGVFRLAAESWRLLSRLVWEKCRLLAAPLGQRIEQELELLAAEFGRPHELGTLIDLDLRHLDLAGMVASTRENVTRHMTKLRRAGRIQVDQRRIILVRSRPGGGGNVPPAAMPPSPAVSSDTSCHGPTSGVAVR